MGLPLLDMSGKKRAPPKAEKLVEFHSNIVKETATTYPGHPVVLAGKSMGSRLVLLYRCVCCVFKVDRLELSVLGIKEDEKDNGDFDNIFFSVIMC